MAICATQVYTGVLNEHITKEYCLQPAMYCLYCWLIYIHTCSRKCGCSITSLFESSQAKSGSVAVFTKSTHFNNLLFVNFHFAHAQLFTYN